MRQEGFIHLCQPCNSMSCGACCGLYNYADSSRDSLTGRLRRRTKIFRDTVKGPEDLSGFAANINTSEDQSKRYEVIYCCEYLGFLDSREKTVGCLLHPFQNGGLDMRTVSFYGKELCEGHFCPSYHYISKEEKKALINIIDDWYLYGLCVTDIDLVKEYFRLISERVYEMPAPDAFTKHHLKAAAHRFFSHKMTWPYRSHDTQRFGKYYFDGSQYMIDHIDYESLGCDRSRFDRIFLSLCSEFGNKDDILRAEAIVQGCIDEFVQVYTMA
jgi:hypothetical protein